MGGYNHLVESYRNADNRVCRRTILNVGFMEDEIILYDLTNTYFEGEKRNSQLAKFGRSKEK